MDDWRLYSGSVAIDLNEPGPTLGEIIVQKQEDYLRSGVKYMRQLLHAHLLPEGKAVEVQMGVSHSPPE
jgi:hypothetical protein